MSLFQPNIRARGLVARERDIEIAPSFEVFPPKTAELEESLWAAVQRLAPLNPRFVSVTYGAGGSTRGRTHSLVRRIVEETGLQVAAHLTCVGANRYEVDAIARDYWHAGVRHIVALRGDPLKTDAAPCEDGYRNATELVAGLRRIYPFEISVGCYPEMHPESPSLAHDIDVLKAKADAGAGCAISQFFFDIDHFLRFVDRARGAGIALPIIPGVLPVTNFAGLKRMAASCGTTIPTWLAELFGGLDHDPQTRNMVAASVAAEMCARLADEGFPDIHFYTLNRPELVYAVCRMLGAPRQER